MLLDVKSPVQGAAHLPVVLWPAAMALWGPGDESGFHAHHAMHLMLARAGRLKVRTTPRGKWRDAGAVLVGPDVPHAIDARGLDVVLLFVEPESEIGSRLRAGLRDRSVHLFEGEADRVLRQGLPATAPLEPDAVGAWMRHALQISPQDEAKPMHPRVRRVLRKLRAGELPLEKLTLDQLATVAGLSPSRFLHAFTESVGVPVRPYLLWLRLQLAAGVIASGARIGEAAHAAGFSDAAHLSRTFRRMFGTPASALVRRSQFVQARRGVDPSP